MRAGLTVPTVQSRRSLRQGLARVPDDILKGNDDTAGETMRPLIPVCLAIFLSGAAHAAGDVHTGRLKADTCLGCHGIANYQNVYPTYHVPKLGGQSAAYIIAALQAYQRQDRPHSTMRSQAHDLSAEDMADIAAYFSSLADVEQGAQP
jgi:cytochrome c553